MSVFSPNKKLLPYTGGTFTLEFSLTVNEPEAQSWRIEYIVNGNEKSFFVSIKEYSGTDVKMTITANANNNGTVERVCSFRLVQFTGDNIAQINHRYDFRVDYDRANLYKPIWEDVAATSVNSTMEYTITNEDGEVLYSGKAMAEPNNDKAEINVNKICSNYLSNDIGYDLDGDGGFTYNYDYAKLFKINEKNDSLAGQTTIAQYRFYNSYAYDKELDNIFNSDPIKREYDIESLTYKVVVDRRQLFMCSAYNRSEEALQMVARYVKSGKIYDVHTLALDNTAQLVYFPKSYYANKLIDYFLLGSNKGTMYGVIQDTCYDYCLYYVNAYGGWDSLLIKGNVKKVDDIKAHYYTKHCNNNSRSNFAKTNYQNDITTSYELHTDWFTDDEQSRLHHLLESPCVYLHNLNTDKIDSVIITNNKCEYKTFTNNGKKKWHNTINVECSQTKIRK